MCFFESQYRQAFPLQADYKSDDIILFNDSMINVVILKSLAFYFWHDISGIRRFICLFNPGIQFHSCVMNDKFPFYLYASIGSTETPPINALTFTQKHQGVCSGTSKCFKPDVFIRLYRWQADNKNGLILQNKLLSKKFSKN